MIHGEFIAWTRASAGLRVLVVGLLAPAPVGAEAVRIAPTPEPPAFPATSTEIMHARYFSPNLGRFLSVDPVGGEIGSSQSWNRYSYVRNNPLNMVDPTGEAGKEVADWIDRQVAAFASYVDASTGSGAGAITLNAAVGTAGDVISGAADMLRVGDSTGQAIGEGASGSDLVAAVAQDVGRASALALTMAVPANAALKAGGVAAGEVEGTNATNEVIERTAPGSDGASSRHIIEKLEGKTNSVTHQVTKNGQVVHQHQTHVGKHGTQRQFPDEWVEYPNVPGGGQ